MRRAPNIASGQRSRCFHTAAAFGQEYIPAVTASLPFRFQSDILSPDPGKYVER